MATTLVKSLTRLYSAGTLTKEQIAQRVQSKVLSEADYKAITGEDYPADE